jgi:hypothetical protein
MNNNKGKENLQGEIKKILEQVYSGSNHIGEVYNNEATNLIFSKLQEAHPTKDGYCCACDYDIAGFKKELQEAQKEYAEEIIGKDEKEYLCKCVGCSTFVEGRNQLRAEQRARLHTQKGGEE